MSKVKDSLNDGDLSSSVLFSLKYCEGVEMEIGGHYESERQLCITFARI